MIGAVQHNCPRSYAWTMAVLETGVEPKADLIMLQEPPEETGGIGSAIQHTRLGNERECRQQCAREVAWQLTNEQT